MPKWLLKLLKKLLGKKIAKALFAGTEGLWLKLNTFGYDLGADISKQIKKLLKSVSIPASFENQIEDKLGTFLDNIKRGLKEN